MLSCGDFEGAGFVAGLAVERFEEIRSSLRCFGEGPAW